jgi:dTDP-4-dehydrorhamnose 3,5-epimerase
MRARLGSVGYPSVFDSTRLTDERGFFSEIFRKNEFIEATGSPIDIVQINHSRSKRNVLRGLHYQVSPMAQGKLVRVVNGSALDVVVDVRSASPTFGEWLSVELSGDNLRQIWVPEGFAHGFLALSEDVRLVYEMTNYYSPDHDHSLRWDDPEIGIEWPADVTPIMSEKDRNAPSLLAAETFA